MQALSAADAISPAIRRTGTFLFRQFRLGTFLKLSLVAVITEGFGGNFHSSAGHAHHNPTYPSGHASAAVFSSFQPTPRLLVALLVGALVVAVVGFVIAYLVTRLRFAYFHCLVYNTRQIAPGWRLYGQQAWRFFWMNIAVGICFLLAVVLALLPFAAGIWRLVRETPPGGHPDLGLILSVVLPLIPIILLAVIAAIAIDVVLRDWMLPHYALENATAGQAWAAVWENFQDDAGQFILYAVLRIIMPIAAMIGLFIAMVIPAILFAGFVAVLEVAVHAAFASATGGAAVGGIVLQVLIGVVALALAVLASLFIGGPLSTGIREYALLFYGGRYQRLGDILAPPAAGLGTV